MHFPGVSFTLDCIRGEGEIGHTCRCTMYAVWKMFKQQIYNECRRDYLPIHATPCYPLYTEHAGY